MKALKTAFVLCLSFLMIGQVHANSNSLNPQKKLKKQIEKIVGNIDAWDSVKKDIVFKVSFTINSDGEIIVLATNKKKYTSLAKSIFQNHKVDVDQMFHNKIIVLPLRFTKTKS